MKSSLLGFGTLALALLFAAALPVLAHAGSVPYINISNPTDGVTVYGNAVKLFFTRDLGAEENTVEVYLNGALVPGITPPSGIVNGLVNGENTIKVIAVDKNNKPTGLEASVTFDAEP